MGAADIQHGQSGKLLRSSRFACTQDRRGRASLTGMMSSGTFTTVIQTEADVISPTRVTIH